MRKSVLAVAASASVFAMVVAGATTGDIGTLEIVSPVVDTRVNTGVSTGGITVNTLVECSANVTLVESSLDVDRNDIMAMDVQFNVIGAGCVDQKLSVVVDADTDTTFRFEANGNEQLVLTDNTNTVFRVFAASNTVHRIEDNGPISAFVVRVDYND